MRGLPRLGAALLWAVSLTSACSVDQSGLETSAKLSRDAGASATGGTSPGTGGDRPGTGGGTPGTGGSVTGTGGSPVVGAGGDALGTGGSSPGAGGIPGLGAGGSGGEGADAGAGGQAGGSVAAGGAGGQVGAGGNAGAGGAMGATGGRGGSGGHCSALTCKGCCAGDVCVTSPSAQQCGARGAACTACGPCQTCSTSGACAIDPTSPWTIVAVGAKVATSPPLGGTWDPLRGDEGGTAPDLFCEYENPSGDVSPTTAGVTDTLIDTTSATWNQTITPAGVTVSAAALMAAKPAWRIWVGDEDCSKLNVCTGGQIVCSYQQPFTAAQLMSGAVTITKLQSCNSLNLQLNCAAAP
jgi:hypothetical protein